MVEKTSNNKKSTNSNGQANNKEPGLFGRIINQITQEMKEGEKEELAGLRRSGNNKKANSTKAEQKQLSGSKVEAKQLPAGKEEQEQKQLAGSKTSAKKTTTTKTTSIKSKKTNKLVTYTGVTSDGRPAWVKAMDNTRKQEEEEAATNTDNTFAGQYLMPTPSNSRRKPGPSLNMFKDMARQVKIPKNVKKG